MATCLVGLGANLGDRAANLDRALELLHDPPTTVVRARSRWIESAPVGGPPDQPAYLNGAAVLETALAPHDVLARLQQVEHQLGRRRDARWVPRVVDLDLLLYDDRAIETPALTVPHPRLAFRRFVLVPAVEIAADWVHPQVGWSLRQLLSHLDRALPYVAIAGMPGSGQTQLAQAVTQQVSGVLIGGGESPRSIDSVGINPAGLDAATVIESLEEGGRCLARDRWPSDATVAVGDFWFDEWLIFARAVLSADEVAAVEAWEREVRPRIVSPKLLVWLDVPSDKVLNLPEDRHRAWQAAFRTAVRQPNRGPMLTVTTTDPREQCEEVAAAIAAMQ